VGKYVALGGHAYHLRSAVDHIKAAMESHKDHPASKAMANFYDAKMPTTQNRKKVPQKKN